jgi:hypothetical protein
MEVEKHVGPHPERKMVGNVPYTARVKKVLTIAGKEAETSNHSYVGLAASTEVNKLLICSTVRTPMTIGNLSYRGCGASHDHRAKAGLPASFT